MADSIEYEGRDPETGKFLDKNIYSILRKRIGKPKKFLTPEDLASKALEYFDWCVETKNKITFAGCRLWLNMSREDWSNYKNNENYTDYFDTIRHIEQTLENEWEGKLGWAGSTQGAIFWLKNKAGWKDEVVQHQHQTLTKVEPQVINNAPPLGDGHKD